MGKGLTAEKTAHLLMDGGWELFGLPSLITCNQGPQFTGQWFRTMCARLGIRVAYSQAYRPQANGRAEVAGRILKGLLRKFAAEAGGVNWVEALPRLLFQYHGTKMENGMSPFQMIFGRERSSAGLPTLPPRECESAKTFLERMEVLDWEVSTAMNYELERIAARVNQGRKKRTPFAEGD